MTAKPLNEAQLEALQTLGFALTEDLGTFLFFEAEGFGDWTVSDLVEVMLDLIQKTREEAS